jgi:predicted ABC-type ATPase
MLQRIRELARERRDFAFETTLASRTFAPWLRKLQSQGHRFHLVYLWLPTVELAVGRVAERVRRGATRSRRISFGGAMSEVSVTA